MKTEDDLPKSVTEGRTPRRRYDGKVPPSQQVMLDKLCDIIDYGKVRPRWLKRLRSVRRDIVANGRFSLSQISLVVGWGQYRPLPRGQDHRD